MTTEKVATLPVVPGGRIAEAGAYDLFEYEQSIDLASAAASTGANQDVAVTGLEVDDLPVYVVPAAALTVGVIPVPLGPVATVNTLRLRVINPTIAAVDAGAANYRIGVLRLR